MSESVTELAKASKNLQGSPAVQCCIPEYLEYTTRNEKESKSSWTFWPKSKSTHDVTIKEFWKSSWTEMREPAGFSERRLFRN